MMKVKRSYALELFAVLSNAQTIFGKPVTGRFRYTVSVNQKIVDEERKLVLEAFPFDQDFIDYDNRRISILREAGIESNADLVKLTDEERKALEERVLKLRDECMPAIEAQEAIDKERDKFCEEEIELDLRTFGINDIPEIIAPNDWQVWNVLQPLVDESKE